MLEDSDSDDDVGFQINKSYAKKYNTWRRGEEIQKLKDKYGDRAEQSDSSSSEIEDEDAEALTEHLEKGWLRALSALKNKDPKIYQKDATFYSSEESSDDSEENSSNKVKGRKGAKPVYLKDYETKLMIEKYGKESSDESDSGVTESGREHTSDYHRQQEALRKSIVQAVERSDDSEDDGELLTHRKKTVTEEVEEETEYLEWLKGQKKGFTDKKMGKDLEPLQKYWNDPKLDDGEKFLKDFILYKRYIDQDADRIPTYDEVVDDGDGISDDEDDLARQETFERKHNFRYEEPGAETIKSFPRGIADSVRRTDTKRADIRLQKKQRREQEKQQQKQELLQLKKMKRDEIDQKIQRLQHITGNKLIGFSSADLEEDFDPADHDRMMQEYFAEDYYAEGEDVKPVCPVGEDDLDPENWDNWQGVKNEGQTSGEGGEEEEKKEEEDGENQMYAEDTKFIMDADYDPSQDTRARRQKKKKSKLAKALSREKPSFNPDEKTFEEYLDEYYKLDYEDMIGGMPCRFKYRGVVPNNFGLSATEVLLCRDKELNSWVSVKKMSQYRSDLEEKRDISVYRNRAATNKKLNILSSLRESDKNAAGTSTSDPTDLIHTSKKKKRKKTAVGEVGGGGSRRAADAACEESHGLLVRGQNTATSPTKHGQIDVTETFSSPAKHEANVDRGESETEGDSNKKRKRKRQKHRDSKPESKPDVETNVSVSRSKKKVKREHVRDGQGGESVSAGSHDATQSKKKMKRKQIDINIESASNIDTNVSVSMSNKKKKRKHVTDDQGGESVSEMSHDATQSKRQKVGGTVAKTVGKELLKRSKKKRGKRNNFGLSDERLKAYGMDPKKMKYMKIDNFKKQKKK